MKSKRNNSRKEIGKRAFYKLDWRIVIGIFIVILIIALIFTFIRNFSAPEEKIILDNPKNSGSVVIPMPIFTFKDISLIDAIKLFNENKGNPDFRIIDVSSDYNNGHIVNAVNYPIDSFEISIVGLDKTNVYLVYSRNEESRIAAKIMADNGFENVYRLQGNYGAWVQAGFPVEH